MIRMRAAAFYVSFALSCALAAGRAAAQPPAAESELADATLYLEVFTNGLSQNLIMDVQRRGGRFYVATEDFDALGLTRDDLAGGPDGRIALDDVPGLAYDYLPLEQRLDLTVVDARMTPQLLGYAPDSMLEPSSGAGVVLNYALTLQSQTVGAAEATRRVHSPLIRAGYARSRLPGSRAADDLSAIEAKNQTAVVDLDLRVFSQAGLFVNRGYITEESGESDSLRYDSYWTYSSLDPLRTYVAGDFIGSSLTWTRSLRLGGVSIARNFGLRPDLVTFPIPTLGGSAVVPTTVDLYVNDSRQFSGQARPGPFLITDPLALTGAGRVSIVYRDELGREVTTTQPLYVDSRLLEAGLRDYALETGYPRRNYGTFSNDYGEDLATVGSMRYGASDRITVEGHAEQGEDLQNFGVGGLFSIGRFGVLSASLSVSDSNGRGKQTSAGYQYVARRWSLDIYEQRTHDDYRDLGSLEDSPVPELLRHAGLTFTIGRSHSLSIFDVRQQAPDLGDSHVLTLGYSASWSNTRLGLYASLFRDYEQEDSDGAYLGLSYAFGERGTLSSGGSQYGTEKTAILGAGSPVDYDLGGFGWNFYGEKGNDDYHMTSSRADYRFRYGDWSLMLDEGSQSEGDSDDYSNTSVRGNGAIAYMGRQLLAARTIYDGFAVVSTTGTPGVPVLRENRLLGETNRNGFYLVPDLPSYQSSRLAIDPLGLPADVLVGVDRLEANPREGSGLLVEFPLGRYSGATVILVDARGEPLPPGTRVTLLGTGETALVGFDGQVFFPMLEAVNRIAADTVPVPCEVEVRFEPEQAMLTIGPFVCGAP